MNFFIIMAYKLVVINIIVDMEAMNCGYVAC